jgi:anti-anti-sigma factor
MERSAHAAPSDDEAARRYEAALSRAGQREVLQERYRFKYLCPLTFDSLEPTEDAMRRFCGECERDVHLVIDVAGFNSVTRANQCVSVPAWVVDEALGSLIDNPARSGATEAKSLCLLGGNSYLDEAPLPGVPEGVLLTFKGKYDGEHVASFAERMNFLMSGYTRFVLDLSGVPTANSVALGNLVRVADTLRSRNGVLVLARVRAQLQLVIEMLGLNAFFDLAETLEEAIDLVRRPPPPPGAQRGPQLLGSVSAR